MDGPLPLSVLLLARDEARDLEELLPRLRALAREVVVVWDPRGDPAARDAARAGGAVVHEHAFAGFGTQRRFALERCREPWVLWLDADERLDSTASAAVRAAVSAESPLTHHRLERVGFFLGARIRWCGWRNERLVRLFRRERARFDDALVHERVTVDGPGPGELAGALEHHSYRTWADCTTKLARYAEANAEQAWRAGRRAGPLDVLLRPPLRFARMYLLQLGLLDGAPGLVLCALAATQVLLKYAGLWARARRGGTP